MLNSSKKHNQIPSTTQKLKIQDRPKNTKIENARKQELFFENISRFKYNRKLIVSIDDSKQVISLMEEIIKQEGYNFLGIQNPLDAIPVLMDSQPNLIFLDLVMPTFSGYEICYQIKTIPKLKLIPIIMLTSNSSLPNKLRAKISGVTEFLAKPFTASKIIKILDKYLSGSASD